MNPHTGAVYVMASSPTYDPNLIDKPGGYAKVLKIRGACGGASALLNRATQGLYSPGSTFKMITAAAALDTGAFKRRLDASTTPATAPSTASRSRTPATRIRAAARCSAT